MACGVKVLKVQGVVPCLIAIATKELPLSYLELYGNDDPTNNHYGINPRPKAGNVELKRYPSINTSKRAAQNVNFVAPRTALSLSDLE
jgi:hypothetical protein